MDIITNNNINEENIYVSVYGTLRPGFGNNRLLLTSTYMGTGNTANKYTLRASGIPFVSEEPLHNIVVDVYKVNKDTLERLDELEGHPDWYCRKLIPIKLENTTIDAWLYFNDKYPELPIIESGDYKKK